MDGSPVNLITDEESNSSSSEESPDINIPTGSYKCLSRQHIRSKPISESEDSSDDDSNSAPDTRSDFAQSNAAPGTKRAKVPKDPQAAAAAKRRKLEEEREARKRRNAELDIYRPGQCIKFVYMEMHPTLASTWFMADVTRELESIGARILTTSQVAHPGLVVWTRVMPRKITTEDGQVKLTPHKQPCAMSLYICTSEELAERVAQGTLLQHIGSIREMVEQLTVIVFGDFKDSARRTANSNRKPLNELHLEQIKIDLLISNDVDVQFIQQPNELSMWIMQCTKAIAEEPHKKMIRDMDYATAGFYMRGDNKKCVSVNREGNGLGRLWQQMISILPSASLETARALCAKYKTPLALMESMDQANGLGELADIGVTRAGAPESRARRLGPEFARKLHLLYSSRNGNIVVE